jgi:sec-independent protein translocase protein TatA
MFGLGLPELLIILVIVLILFGTAKLPQIGSGLGQAIRDFKKGIREEALEDFTKQEKTANKEDRRTPRERSAEERQVRNNGE